MNRDKWKSIQSWILISIIGHITTYSMIALGSIYETKWLTVGALVIMAISIRFAYHAIKALTPIEEDLDLDDASDIRLSQVCRLLNEEEIP